MKTQSLIIRPWVCFWETDGKEHRWRCESEVSARAMQLVHNRDKPDWAEVAFDPDAERFPL